MNAIAVEEIFDLLDDRTVEILESRQGERAVRRRGWLVRRALFVADVVGLSMAFLVAQVAYAASAQGVGNLNRLEEFSSFVASLPFWVLAAKLYGLYDRDEERTDHSTTDDFSRLFHLVTVCSFLLYLVAHETGWFHPEFGKLFFFWLFAIFTTVSLRVVARAYCRRRIEYLQNTIIVGAGQVGQTLARKLLKHPEYGVNLVGFIDDHPMARIDGLEHLTLLGGPDQLPELIPLLDVERVIYAFSGESHEESLDLIRALNELDVQVDIVPRFFDVLSPGVDVHTIEGIPMWGLPAPRLPRSSQLVKRLLDTALAGLGLALLLPAFGVIAGAIRWESRGPVFFRQTRMGAGGVPFKIWKFRTMAVDAESRKSDVAHLNKHLAPGGDPRMFKIDDDPRVTRVGGLLRRWSLDELPQLINVLVGEMSLVGPRPLIPEEHRHIRSWGARRLILRPGITGLWQVLGRDGIGFEEMVRLDYRYVTTWTPWTDIRLLAQTLPAVLRSRGA